MGSISTLGNDAAACWDTILEGRSSIGPITKMPIVVLGLKIPADVRGHDPTTHFDAKRLVLLDRVSQYALVFVRGHYARMQSRYETFFAFVSNWSSSFNPRSISSGVMCSEGAKVMTFL